MGLLHLCLWLFSGGKATVDGLQFYVGRHKRSRSVFRALHRGKYESRERDIVKLTLSSDDRVLDVGGGIGVVALTAARHVATGAVTVVEANPDLIPLIRRNAQKNGLAVQVIHGAANTGGGVTEFYVDENYLSSTLMQSSGKNKIEVPSLSFVDLINEVRPSYLIMDVEGAEIDLLKSLDKSIVKKICVETHPSKTGRQAVIDMIAVLNKNGFAVDRKLSRGNVLYLC